MFHLSSSCARSLFGFSSACIPRIRFSSSTPMSVLSIFGMPAPGENEETKGGKEVTMKGWVQTVRNSKHCTFIELNDGSYHKNLQIVVDKEVMEKDQVNILTGASLSVYGDLVYQLNKRAQTYVPEIQCKSLKIIGDSTSEYPLQKKYHTREFLRENLHLRPRTKRFASTMRIRSSLALELQKYLANQGIVQIHTPVITSNDCEGSGELLTVNTPQKLSKMVQKNKMKYFFNKPAFLGVSGQLHAEAFACAMSKVYTFGPTFRAEMSHTQQHLAEFWMLEPEIVHADLDDCIALTRDMIIHSVRGLQENPMISSELEYLLETGQKFQETSSKTNKKQTFADTLKFSEETLKHITNPDSYHIITYDEAISLLSKHSASLTTPVDWTEGMTREHELFLVHTLFEGKPVFVINYPTVQKAFYMKKTSESDKVACMDLLFPIVGEVAGGSVREDSYDVLLENMKERNIGMDGEYDWYLDLRKYGSVPHAGFGLGFERLLQVLTSTRNIRDVIPMPRSFQNCQL